MTETTAVAESAPVEIPAEVAPFLSALKIIADRAITAREAYKAATSKPDESWKSVSEANPEHPALLKFNEYAEKIDEQIKVLTDKRREARAATLAAITGEQEVNVSEDEAKALKATFVEAKNKYAKTKSNILLLIDGDENALNSYLKAAGITEVNNLGGGAPKGGTGEIVRLRLSDAWVDKEPVQDSNGKVSFTTLSSHLKVDAGDLRDAAAAAGNVSSVRDLPKGEDVTFTIKVEDTEHEVTIRPAVPAKSE